MDYNTEFKNIINDLNNTKEVQEMKKYIHHYNTSCYEHSLNVAYFSYLIAKKHNMDYKSVARAGLLHDLFLYDWHEYKPKNFFDQHGLSHPKSAYNNAKKITNLNKIEEDIIKKHMWPITIKIPKYKESWIVSTVDKLCAIHEFLTHQKEIRKHNKTATILAAIILTLFIKI